MDRRERAFVAGVHRLQHVDRLGAANLADDDPVGAHAKRVPYELPNPHLALAFDVRRAGLERDDMLLLQLQLGRVLDRDDALVVRDEAGQDVQQRRLADAGTARDQHVELAAHARRENVDELRGQRAEVDQVVRRQRIDRELPDRQHRPLQRDGRQDHVHTRPVRQPRIDHRRRLVDAPTDARDDAVDHTQQVILAREPHIGLAHEPATLDEDLLVAVDHDLGDRRVAQERIDRPVAEHVVDDSFDQPRALFGRQPLGAARELTLDDRLHAPPQFFGRVVERPELGPDLRHAQGVQCRAQLREPVEQPLRLRRPDASLQGRALVVSVVPVNPLLQRHVSSSRS